MPRSPDNYIVQPMPLEEVWAVYLSLIEEFMYDGFTKLAQGRFDLWQAHADGWDATPGCRWTD